MKFKFGQKVKVTKKGFYENQTGIVLEVSEELVTRLENRRRVTSEHLVYSVEISYSRSNPLSSAAEVVVTFREDDLEECV